jgi:hypothetical protein
MDRGEVDFSFDISAAQDARRGGQYSDDGDGTSGTSGTGGPGTNESGVGGGASW